ncbi:MAG: hypothetical protein U1E26_08520 [Coriobacteriia bacterium]|nr:hypothetical protein [Coriobacteriia bacterium]
MSRFRLQLPVLMISLLVLVALLALQCPEAGCHDCGADEVFARQGVASQPVLIVAALPHSAMAPFFSVAPLRSIAVPISVAEHPALASRLRI